MKRIDTSSRQIDKFGSGKDGFTNGVPGVTATTALTDSWFDHLQEEVARSIEAFGVTLNSSTYDQLAQILLTLTPRAEYQGQQSRSAFMKLQGAFTSPDLFSAGFCANTNPSIGAGEYAFYAAYGNGKIRASVDGTTWEEAGAGSFIGNFRGIIATNTHIVAYGQAGTIFTAAPGAHTWTQRKSGGGTLVAAAYNGSSVTGLALAVDDAGHVWRSLTNSQTSWTDLGGLLAAGVSSLAYGSVLGGEGWVAALGSSEASVAISTDAGTSWTTAALTDAFFERVVYTGLRRLRWVAVGADGSGVGGIWTSEDATTWTRIYTESLGVVSCRFVTTAPGGVLVTGTDVDARPVFVGPDRVAKHLPRLAYRVASGLSFGHAPVQAVHAVGISKAMFLVHSQNDIDGPEVLRSQHWSP